MKQVKTFTASIYVGLRVGGYGPYIADLKLAEQFLHEFVDGRGLCVTLTKTKFIYTSKKASNNEKIDGEEPGFIVGLINYPMYPTDEDDLRQKAIKIAEQLRVLYSQLKVTIVFPDTSITIEKDDPPCLVSDLECLSEVKASMWKERW